MPVSVVVGGQFGSEGKGKVALNVARRTGAAAVVRVGGTNSGHTGVDAMGNTRALRQLPAAALARDTLVVLPAGSLIDKEIFLAEIRLLGLSPDRVMIDPDASVISDEDKQSERSTGLVEAIGSTASGTGAALQRRISRELSGPALLAKNNAELIPYVHSTTPVLRELLDRGRRVVIEGTQGFGLSVLHGGYYPKATSRDTTAAGFLSEAGLSPIDVDQVVMVIRAFPIRVAGNSGPLPNETTWDEIARNCGLPEGYHELTTATHKVRRVAYFDADVVRRAISVNAPTEIVLNHLDYADRNVRAGVFGAKIANFIHHIEEQVGRNVDWLGTGPDALIRRSEILFQRTA